ncbi:hypothetical protein R6Q57_027455 [Mikania cordata]
MKISISVRIESSGLVHIGSNNINNTDIPATAEAVNSPVAPAAVNYPGTGEDLIKSSDITPNGKRSKKPKLDSSSGGDHRKEREKWSDSAIAMLPNSYTEKYIALNRSNLRWKHWKVMEEMVAEGCDKQSRKSIEQCKNKIDNLKKRYKLETQRMGSNGSSSRIWFKKMDYLFGTTTATKSDAASGDADDDDDADKSAGNSSANRIRPSARWLKYTTQSVKYEDTVEILISSLERSVPLALNVERLSPITNASV